MALEEENDINGQIDYPIIEKGRNYLCIFDTGKEYVLRKYRTGILLRFKKDDISDEFWDELTKNGWKQVNLNINEDAEE